MHASALWRRRITIVHARGAEAADSESAPRSRFHHREGLAPTLVRLN